jgi:hypothetical protein
MNKWKSERSPQKKSVPFKPSKKFIKNAVEEYLNRGGRITKLNTGNSYYSTMPVRSPVSETDDFLA